MRVHWQILIGFKILAALDLNAPAQPLVFQSSDRKAALLELFTSEGCSSCPPAETWLSGLKSAPGLWKEFVPVSFHVDYWDQLGWKDPWGTKAFSDRQRAYAQSWQSDSIYTPGFVLDGMEWRAWSREKHAPGIPVATAGVLQLNSTDRTHWQVSFSPPTPQAPADYEAHAALLANDLTSSVKAGENRGRQLQHDFVVLSLVSCRLKMQEGKPRGEFELRIENQAQPGRKALAAWLTRPGHLEPLQAVGAWLSGP